MKLEEAIREIELAISYAHFEPNTRQEVALKLGIEALKRLIAWRNDNDEDLLWDLPGETED